MDEHSHQKQPDPYRAARQFESLFPGAGIDAPRGDQGGIEFQRDYRHVKPYQAPKGILIATIYWDRETGEVEVKRRPQEEIDKDLAARAKG